MKKIADIVVKVPSEEKRNNNQLQLWMDIVAELKHRFVDELRRNKGAIDMRLEVTVSSPEED